MTKDSLVLCCSPTRLLWLLCAPLEVACTDYYAAVLCRISLSDCFYIGTGRNFVTVSETIVRH